MCVLSYLDDLGLMQEQKRVSSCDFSSSNLIKVSNLYDVYRKAQEGKERETLDSCDR